MAVRSLPDPPPATGAARHRNGTAAPAPAQLGVAAPAAVVVADHADASAAALPPPGEGVFVFPATSAQRRAWVLDNLQPGGNPAMNVALTLWLSGGLDPLALDSALGQIGERHEVLRTVFRPERGGLQQVIAESAPPLRITYVDAADFPTDDRDGVVPHLIAEEARRPLDITRGPLWRATLVRAAAHEHFLLLTLHHIICDGWSTGVLLRDLQAFYDAAVRRDKAPPLPPLSIQFADYAEFLANAAAENETRLAPSLAYWRETLGGRLPAVELPTDRPRPGRAAARRVAGGGMETALLPRELTSAARTLAAREGVSPFMLYFTAFCVLLHRLSGETDLVVNTPAANRNQPETEDLIGLFINPLILRVSLAGEELTARGLLGRVRRTALDAFTHGEVPFERLVEELRPERLPVAFQHLPTYAGRVELAGGVRLTPLPAAIGGAFFELNGAVMEGAESGEARVWFEYNADLFDANTVRRLLGYFTTVLEGIIADPETPVDRLPLLPEAERRQGTLEFPPHLPAGPPPPDLRGALTARVAEAPDAPAAREGRRALSCAELLAGIGETVDGHAALAALAGRAVAWRTGATAAAVAATAAETPADFTARCLALCQRAELRAGESLASFSPPDGLAAREEAGAALLAGAVLVSPRAPAVLTGPPTALAAWLAEEKIAVACLPAAAWNRLAASGAPLADSLRLVVATLGSPEDGTAMRAADVGALRIINRGVWDAAGGTVTMAGRPVAPTVRIGVLDPRTGAPQPTSVAGTLRVALAGSGTFSPGELARRCGDGSVERLGDLGDEPPGATLVRRRLEWTLRGLTGVRHVLADAAGAVYVLPMDPASPPDAGTLRRAMRDVLLPGAAAAVPALVWLPDLPLTAAGTLDRAALPALPPAAADPPEPEPDGLWLTIQHQLKAIWEEVLGVENIGLHDDFFALGGNSLLALRMLSRVEAVCGRVVLPSTLFTKATVAGLAEEIARQANTAPPALLPIQETGSEPPFFYLHGDLTGGGFYCMKLSRALGPEQPFYALPPIDLSTLPLGAGIGEMAAAHWEAIRGVRPRGPYRIGGFCVGGLVAFELARVIAAAGEEVESLFLIDAELDVPGLRRLRWGVERMGRLRGWDPEAMLAQFTRGHYRQARLERWFGLPRRHQGRIVWSHVRRLFGERDQPPPPGDAAAGGEGNPGAIPAGGDESAVVVAAPGWDVPGAFLWAMAAYRPAPFEGATTLLLSADLADAGRANPSKRWARQLSRLRVRRLTGSHLACITDHVDALSQTLRECLTSRGNEVAD